VDPDPEPDDPEPPDPLEDVVPLVEPWLVPDD
jgi:hypothetical protein